MIPELELVVVRDPDGGTEVTAFLGGQPYPATEYVIDAGHGADWHGWKETRDANLAAASPAARAELLDAYDDPPGGEYIVGREREPWLDAEAAENGPGPALMTRPAESPANERS
ncbi:hypothetical protein J6397_28110 [Rhodococcus qingshengii]|uniref:hypothetical protein n=1 Tax=Rhodococcus TaxID=1827 RepID=UPI0019282985|nr:MULTISPECIES: hypothetical protein [Rhodococcus]MBP1054028.1 hypothetical protein [Rhodococcus qingshengii]MBP2527574.1 hypothetical protein [Rhodococcus sp. PvP104]MDA3637643.1 hypothetical protein [Rhodococcus sp. C-2]